METKSKPNFYDSSYWAGGQGQVLWNMRKLLAFIMRISNPDTPPPFLTAMHKSDYDETWTGWYASWNEGSKGKGQLYLEYEENEFCVYAFDGNLNYEFWYYFGVPDEDKTETDKENDWSDLDKAVADAKRWLEDHREELKKPDFILQREFNIYE